MAALSMAALPDDVLYAVCTHLPATALLAFSRCCRRTRRVCLGAIHTVRIASNHGGIVCIYVSAAPPTACRSRRVDPFFPDAAVYPADTKHLAAAGPRGHADAVSLLSFLRAARPRWLGLQLLTNMKQAPALGPLTLFFLSLTGGMGGLAVRELALDAAVVRRLAPSDRFPAGLESLTLTDMALSPFAPRIPAIHSALVGARSLRELRVYACVRPMPLRYGCSFLTSYVRYPLPALRNLELFGPMDSDTTSAVRRLSSLTALALSGIVMRRALRELALPALPFLEHVDMANAMVREPESEAAFLRGRTLQSLSPSSSDPVLKGAWAVHLVTLTNPLPATVDMAHTSDHCDVRPLADHPGASSVRSLSFRLGVDADAILAAVAAQLVGLRDLSLVTDGAGGFSGWPQRLRLERLALREEPCRHGGPRLGVLLPALAESPLLRAHLRRLEVYASEWVPVETVVLLGRLRGLRELELTLPIPKGGAAEERQQLEAAVRASVCAAVRIQWVKW